MFVLILTYKAPIEKVIELSPDSVTVHANCWKHTVAIWISIMLPESFLLPGRRCPGRGELFFAVLRAVQK